MAKLFTYSKNEKLKSRKMTNLLFTSGKTFSVFPLKVFYMQPAGEMDFNAKVGVGATTRNFKKAVDRNRIKRLLREAYRTEKLPLQNYLNEEKKQIVFFILYFDKTLPEKNIIKNKMPLVIEKLLKLLNEKNIANT
jgi:ribonuclease P protein component